MGPDIVVVNHIIDTYFRDRIQAGDETVAGWFKSAYSVIWATDKKMSELNKSCDDMFQLLKQAREQKTPQKRAEFYVEIMLDLGDKAFKSQELSSANSAFSEALHAIRAFLYKELSETQIGRNAILEKIDKLRLDYNAQNEYRTNTANNNRDRDSEVAKATARRHEDLRQIAYLGKIEAELTDNMDLIFPGLKKPTAQSQAKKLRFYKKTLDSSLPYVLHPAYETLYPNRNVLERGASASEEISFADYEKACYAAFAIKHGEELLNAHKLIRESEKEADEIASQNVAVYVCKNSIINTPVIAPVPEPTNLVVEAPDSPGSRAPASSPPKHLDLRAEQQRAAANPKTGAPQSSILQRIGMLGNSSSNKPAAANSQNAEIVAASSDAAAKSDDTQSRRKTRRGT